LSAVNESVGARSTTPSEIEGFVATAPTPRASLEEPLTDIAPLQAASAGKTPRGEEEARLVMVQHPMSDVEVPGL